MLPDTFISTSLLSSLNSTLNNCHKTYKQKLSSAYGNLNTNFTIQLRVKMGFLSVLKKMRQKEKEMRILLLYV